jgi:predicted nucleic acid-binding protein
VTVYFDTSALVKLFISEEGSKLAEDVWGAPGTPVASPLTYAEVRAALAAASRAGRISAPALRRSVAGLRHLWLRMSSVALDDELAEKAGDLAQAHGLRGPDAVHLASALSIKAPDVVLARWDRALARAARAAGCAVLP